MQYKAAVKSVVKAPIRVSAPAVESYSNDYKYDHERVAEDQAKSAHYSFGSAIDDGIQDLSNIRQETRDGLKVKQCLKLHQV